MLQTHNLHQDPVPITLLSINTQQFVRTDRIQINGYTCSHTWLTETLMTPL
jgi:hypothetical protein